MRKKKKTRVLIPSEEWRDHARCAGKVSRDFDPFDVEDHVRFAPKEALAMCNVCPVKVQCLSDAVKFKESGVRGGLTFKQRKALARTRLRKRCPACNGTEFNTTDIVQLCMKCGHSWRTELQT